MGPGRTLQEVFLEASILGREIGAFRLERVRDAALNIPENADPVEALERMLEQAGMKSPEDLRERYRVPEKPLLAQSLESIKGRRLDPLGAPRDDIFRAALILGLCTEVHYDPQRPVIWTQASLSRRLRLFDPEEFYK